MARLIVTDGETRLTRVRNAWMRAGLREGAVLNSGNLYAASALKRSIKHENCVIRQGDHWVIGVGTYLTWDGASGGDALGVVLDRFDPGAPLDVRNEIFGHYAIAVRQGNRTFVFCDEIGVCDLFWTDGPDGFAVCSFLSDLLPTPSGPDTFSAMSAAYHGERGIAGQSILGGIRTLRGHEWIEIDSAVDQPRAALQSHVFLPARPEWHDIDHALKDYDTAISRVFAAVARQPAVASNVTGGLDSRLVLAAARRHDMTPQLLYGRGNSRMTNTRSDDLHVARAISKAWGWPLSVMDWRQTAPHDADTRASLQERHGYKQPYGGTTGVISSMDEAFPDGARTHLAGYNPAFTNRKPWSWPEEHIAVTDFVARFAADYIDVFKAPARMTYLARLEEDLRTLAEQMQIDLSDNMVSRADATRILIRGREGKEAFNINAFNQFCYYLAPFFTAHLYELLLAVPPEWRAGDRFQLHAIAQNDPTALDLPIFSGLRRYKLDRDAMTMRELPTGIFKRLQDRLRKRMQQRTDTAIRDNLRSALMRHDTDISIDVEQFVLRDLRAVYRFITALEINTNHCRNL